MLPRRLNFNKLTTGRMPEKEVYMYELKNQSLMEGVKICSQVVKSREFTLIHLQSEFQHTLMKDYKKVVNQLLNEIQKTIQGDVEEEMIYEMIRGQIQAEARHKYKIADAWYTHYIGSTNSLKEAFRYLIFIYNYAITMGVPMENL